ncbi:MAG TPA: large-conductance mechanosensitive channel protein MscL [Gemmatimonadaceae bacterium]|nr:large-conductance mechanosensitive channel protein MscL [Gemmatimonadaceae bacterium]
MWKDFKAFIMRGNVLDLAVAVVIGGAFGTIVKSLVDDVIMPPIGLLLGKVDFSNLFVVLKDGTKAPPPYTTPAMAKEAGAVTLNYGAFINNVIAFLIVAAAVFMIVRIVSKLYAKPAPAAPNTKPCPQCTLPIPLAATRCPNCTAVIGGITPPAGAPGVPTATV